MMAIGAGVRERVRTLGSCHLWLLGGLLLLAGCKLFLIHQLASAAPYWDQWEGEASNLYLPYLRGELGWAQLLGPHNEHRMFTARLLFLALVELAGGWNPLLEIVAGALLYVALVGVLLVLLRRALDAAAVPFVALALVAIFAPPVAYENLLWGFQPAFYLFLLAGVTAVALLCDAAPLGPRWWAGIVLSVVAFLSLASGATVPLAAAVVLGLQAAVGSRPRGWRTWTALLLLLGLTGLFYALVPHLAKHEALRAHGLGEAIGAFALIGGWPLRLSLLGPVLLQAPMILLVLRTIRRRRAADHPAWRVIGLDLLATAPLASAAINRAAAPLAPRYLDFCVLVMFLNLVALLLLAREMAPLRRATLRLMAGWVGLVLAFLYLWAARHSSDAIAEFSGARHREVAMIAEGMRTGRPQPIPYEVPERPSQLLRLAEIRGLLPTEFGAPDAEREAVRARLALGGGLRLTTARIMAVTKMLAALCLALGTALLAALGFLASRRPAG